MAAGVLARLRSALSQHGLVRPPSLVTDEARTASRLELFFDLAFVLAIAQLAVTLREHVTVSGVLGFAGLFTVVWWSWASSTLYANRFDHDDAVYRLYKLASMAAVIGMAAAAGHAASDGRPAFVTCAVALRVLLLLQYRRVLRSLEEVRPVARVYARTLAAGALLWAVSLAVPAPACFLLWGAAVAVEVVAPLRATASEVDVPLHLDHLPERFGLFMILVLGESVAALVHGLEKTGWTVDAVLVAGACFALTAGIWWSYFDLAGAGAKRLLNEAGGERSARAHDVYLFGQLPLALSIAAVGAGIQLAVVHSGDSAADPGTRLLIAGGVAIYLTSAGLVNSGMASTWRSGWWWPLGAAVVAGADALLELPAVVVVGALAVLLAVVVVVGTVQRNTGRIAVDPV